MKLTANEEYGMRCLVRLGYAPGPGLTIPEISLAEGVSPAYAAKILRVLRKGGFVKAARGKEGGYTLARPAQEIVIGDVLEALGGRLFESDFCDSHAGQAAICTRSVDCSVRSLWRAVQVAVDQVLSKTTLRDLLQSDEMDSRSAADSISARRHQIKRTGYGSKALSHVAIASPPINAWAISMRSKGSLWNIWSFSAANASASVRERLAIPDCSRTAGISIEGCDGKEIPPCAYLRAISQTETALR